MSHPNLPQGLLAELPPRLAGWRGRANAVLARHRREPFRWGVHDCGVLCADWVEAICGVDPLARYRGRYDSEVSARALLDADGFASHVEVFALSMPREHITRARFGDIAILDGEAGLTTGPVLGEVIAVFDQTRGVGNVPLRLGVGVLFVA